MSLVIDPSTLSPTGWYVASDLDVSVEGNNVSSWADHRGGGYPSLTQGTAGKYPRAYRHGLKDLPFVRFGASAAIDDSLISSGTWADYVGAEGVGTVIAVWNAALNFDATASTAWPIFGVNVSGGSQYFQAAADVVAGPAVPAARVAGCITGFDFAVCRMMTLPTSRVSNGALPSGHHVGCWIHDKVSSTHYVRVGVDFLDDAALVSEVSGADTAGALAAAVHVGRTFSGTAFLLGDLYELIFFETVLTQAQRRGVQLYLTQRYGIAYLSDTAEDSSPPVDAAVKVEAFLPSTELISSLPGYPPPRAWWRADALALANNDPVGSWADSSGNGFTLTASGTARPLFKTAAVNGRPAILFDGVNDVLTTAAGATLSKLVGAELWVGGQGGRMTIFVVAKVVTSGGAKDHVLWSGSTGLSRLYVEESAAEARAVAYDGTEDVATKAATLDAWHVFCWAHSVANSFILGAQVACGVDSLKSADLSKTNSGDMTDQAALFNVGGCTTLSDFLKGSIAEILVFDRPLNAAGQLNALSYLSAKYGTSYYAEDHAGAWVDVTGDVRAVEPLSLTYGIRGASFVDRVASGGRLEMSMDNSLDNAVATVGYYSPDSSSKREGFKLGVKVRVGFTFLGTTYYKWVGRVTDIAAAPGKAAYSTRLLAMDYADECARTTVPKMTLVTDTTADACVEALLIFMPRSFPDEIYMIPSTDVYPFAFDNAETEQGSFLTELQKICMSEQGYFYVRGDSVSGNQVVFEARGFRNSVTVPRWALTGAHSVELELSHSIDDVVNRAIVTAHPRRVDAAATTRLFLLAGAPEILNGASLVLDAPFRDPESGRFVRVGGTSMVAPVSTTDYLFNSAADGSGTNLTAQLSVSATYYSNAATLTITNNGPSDGFLTLLQLRGKGLYSFEGVNSDVRDATSVALYGENALLVDMPYQGDVNLAAAAAAEIVAKNKDPRTRVRAVTFESKGSTVKTMHALAREVGDRITVTETTTGLNAVSYFIQAVTMTVSPEGQVAVQWALAPAAASD